MEVFCRSVLLESERKAHKVLWLGIEDVQEENCVDLHLSLVGGMQESFQSMLVDRPVFENAPSTILQPKSVWSILFGGVEGKAYVMGLRHAFRSVKSLEKRLDAACRPRSRSRTSCQ